MKSLAVDRIWNEEEGEGAELWRFGNFCLRDISLKDR